MAGETVIGVLRADLSLDTAEFQAGAQRAKNSFSTLKKGLEDIQNLGGKNAQFGSGFSNWMNQNDWKVRQFSMQMSQMAQSTLATGQVMKSVFMQLPDIAGLVGGKLFLPAMIISSVAALAQPLISSFFATEDAAKDAEKQINTLSSALQKYSEASKIAHADTEELTKEYGRFAWQARTNARIDSERAIGEAMGAMQAPSEGLGGSVFGAFDAAAAKIREITDEVAGLKSELASGATPSKALWLEAIPRAEEDAKKAAEALKLLPNQVVALQEALTRLRQTDQNNITEMGAAAQAARNIIDTAIPTGSPLPPAIKQMNDALTEIIVTAQRASSTLSADFDALASKSLSMAQSFSQAAEKARSLGENDLASKFQSQASAFADLVSKYRSGAIDGDTFKKSLDSVVASAQETTSALNNIDSVRFGGVISALGGVIDQLAAVAKAAADTANAVANAKLVKIPGVFGAPGSVNFGNPFSGNGPTIAGQAAGDAVMSAPEGSSAWVAAQIQHNSLSREQLEIEREIASVKSDAAAAGKVITAEQARQIALGRIAQSQANSKGSRGGKSEADKDLEKYQNSAKRLEDQLTALKLRYSEGALAAQIFNNQVAAGVEPTSAAGQHIAQLTTEIDAMQQRQEMVSGLQNAFGQFFTSVITGSQSFKEALGQMLMSIAQLLAQKAAMSLFAMAFPGLGFANGTGPGGVGAHYANGTGPMGHRLPAFANGGSLAMVGERGPEIVALGQSSRVFSSKQTESMLQKSGGGRGHLAISLADGLKAEWLADAQSQSVDIVQTGIKQYDRKAFPNSSAKYKQDPRKR